MSINKEKKILGVLSLLYTSAQRAAAQGGLEPGVIPPGGYTTAVSLLLNHPFNGVELRLSWMTAKAVLFGEQRRLLDLRWDKFEAVLFPDSTTLVERQFATMAGGQQATFEALLAPGRSADPTLAPVGTALRALKPDEWIAHVAHWPTPDGTISGIEVEAWDIGGQWDGTAWNSRLVTR